MDRKLFSHVKGNVKLTAWCLNSAKHIFITGVLQVLANFLNSDRGAEAREKVMKEMTNVASVGLLSAIYLRHRLKGTKAKAKREAMEKAWRVGRPSKETGTSTTPGWVNASVGRKPKAGWCPPGWSRFLKVVAQIEAKLGVQFPRSEDGAPYPLGANTMPEDWCV